MYDDGRIYEVTIYSNNTEDLSKMKELGIIAEKIKYTITDGINFCG